MRKGGADCIVFSSQTGVNVDGALRKLSTYSRARGHSVVVRKIESLLIRKFTNRFPRDPSTGLIRGVSGMQYLVFKPKCLIYQLWNNSLQETLQTKSRKTTVFLSMHPIFYSSDSREYYSPVEIDHFRRKLAETGHRVRMVVSLIDDIYDVFRRLRAPNELLSVVDLQQKEQATVESILELMMLLDWRSQEMMRAEQIARSLGVSHYVLATKHPIKVAYDLVFTSKAPVYVSHPISAVRGLQKCGKIREASKIMEEINDLGKELVESRELIPFFPTAIDEYRIAEKSGNFVPDFIPRWPFGRPRTLLYCPPPIEPKNPLDPVHWFSKVGSHHPEQAKMVHELLRALRERIGMQVGARDKKLVDQSNGLVVFRPYFGGILSEGVQKEISHRNNLNEYCPEPAIKRHCVIAIPGDDLRVVRNRLIRDELRQTGRINGSDPSEKMIDKIMTRLQKDHEVQDLIATGGLTGVRLQSAIEGSDLRVIFKDMPTSLGPLSGERKAVQRTWLAQRWGQFATKVNCEDPLKKDMNPALDTVLSSDHIKELVRRAASVIQPRQ